jgi:hypothetical protein
VSVSEPFFYLLAYPRASELRAGICHDWNVLSARLQSEYRQVDLDDSLIAPVSASMAQRLRDDLRFRLPPAHSVSTVPVEDAYSLRGDKLARAVLRGHRVRTKWLSTVLQSQGDMRSEWRRRIKHLRESRSLRALRDRAERAHRQNEDSLRESEEFLEGLEAHADVLYVYSSPEIERSSIEVYAVACSQVSSARLQAYISARRGSSPIGSLSYPCGGGCGFIVDSTFVSGTDRSVYSLTLATHFRHDRSRFAPHILAGIESILARLRSCPHAPDELREEMEAVSRRLWRLLSGEDAEEEPADPDGADAAGDVARRFIASGS